MMTTIRRVQLAAASLLAAAAFVPALAGLPQAVSTVDPAVGSPEAGGGDSVGTVLSSDGRYVLFSSTAHNIALIGTNLVPSLTLPTLDLYLRDRSQGTIVLVSINLAGNGGGDGDSFPVAISTNGRYALFESAASNLVAADTNHAPNLFLRDLVNGSTVLVSASTNGGYANASCRSSVMTPDGRYVAFVSSASNLVPGDANGIPDVFVRDVQFGVTTLVSAGAASTNGRGWLASSEAPAITPDGRYVAFWSTAANLPHGGGTGSDVYVRDLVSGTTTWASGAAQSMVHNILGQTGAVSYNHAISADGQFVAYAASPSSSPNFANRGLVLRYNTVTGLTDVVNTNAWTPLSTYGDNPNLDLTSDGRFIALVACTNDPASGDTCIMVWDGQTGSATLASGDLGGGPPTNTVCGLPSFDSSGRYVAFLCTGATLVTNIVLGGSQLYVRALQAGVTTLVNLDATGTGSALEALTIPSLSADGSVVAFDSPDANLVAGDRNHAMDGFVRDLAAARTELVSGRLAGLPSVTGNRSSSLGSVSHDGRLIAFATDADDLAASDSNGFRNVLLRDLVAGTNLLISAGLGGLAADGLSSEAVMTPDGRYVAFSSSADDLAAVTTNHIQNVFVRDVVNGTLTLVSVAQDGASPANGASYYPSISPDGRYVVFRSRATNLAKNLYGETENLFVRDLLQRETWVLTSFSNQGGGVVWNGFTPDGRYVGVVQEKYFSAPSSELWVWDTQTSSFVYTNMVGNITAAAIGPGATNVAYFSINTANPPQGALYAANEPANTNWVIATGAPSAKPGLRFTPDGRFLVYAMATDTPGTNQIYRYDFQTGSNLLASPSYISAGPASADSDSPDISADGRYVAFRSVAADLVPGATNGLPNVYVFDTLSGATTLLSASSLGGGGDNRSESPLFSGDGTTLFFDSWASDLIAQDFNQARDVFAVSLLPSGTVPVFSVRAVFGGTGSSAPMFIWPVTSGISYRAQYKDSLADPAWLDCGAGVTVAGAQGSFHDPSPPRTQRFYRIVAF